MLCTACCLLSPDIASLGQDVIDQPDSVSAAKNEVTIQKLTTEHLPNVVQVTDRVYSGGLPEGDAGFLELQQLGIKTVISVDGITPNIDLANRYGLKYIHLPHGYDGVPNQRILEISKAVREQEGPVYIHCHHGKHRSPAAAASACLTIGWIQNAQAFQVLQVAGTNPNYRGLFESVKNAKPVAEKVLDALEVQFHEVEPLPPLADAMVDLDHAFEHIQLFAKKDWRLLEEHPDLVPAHEALLLREQYTELLRADYVESQSDVFKELLVDAEIAAKELESILNSAASEPQRYAKREQLAAAVAKISSNCKACHEAVRDIPLSEKQPQ